MSFIIDLPAILVIIILIIISTLITHFGIKIVQKKFSHEQLIENHEVAGYIYNAMELMYAVLMAFVVYINWNNYDAVKKNIYSEAEELGSLFMDTYGYPDSVREPLQQAIYKYTKSIYEEEWNSFEKGVVNEITYSKYLKIWEEYFKLRNNPSINQIIYQESIQRLNFLGDCRNLRIFHMQDKIPFFIWSALLVYCFISCSFMYFFSLKHKTAHTIMASTFTFVNLLMFYLVLALDHPFIGVLKIQPKEFIDLINSFNKILLTGV